MSAKEVLNETRPKRLAVVVAAGLVSGALSAVLFGFEGQRFAWVVPGVAFGVILGAMLFLLHVARLWQAALFAAASEASWYAAYWFALTLFEWIGNTLPNAEGKMVVIGLAAGAIGAALLGSATAALFPWLRSWRRLLGLVLLGGVTGMLLGVDWGKGYPLFMAWQGAFALGLALALPPVSERRSGGVEQDPGN
jgi:hypothetical protein